MDTRNNIRQRSKSSKTKLRRYRGELPHEPILPEKLAKANDLLKSIKDLITTLANYKK